VRPAPRTVRPAAAVAAVVLAVVVAAVVWARSAPPAAPVAVLPPRSSTAPAPLPPTVVAGAPAAAGATGGTVPSPRGVVVDVEGRVRHPGLVHLPAGARVADALAAAGGAAPGAVVTRLNLARVLADGEQVLVPAPGDPVADAAPPSGAPAAGDAGSAAGAAAGPLDLNAATAAALDQLPGVGPVLAGRIVAWRAAHGRFTTVDELGEVEGIGPKALERLRPLVRV
jgi:competence protein ComEA